MNDRIFQSLDRYTLRARVMPALLVILPATLAVAAWFPGKLALLGGLLGFVAVFGSICFLGECIRDRGKVIEPRLIRRWGGLPTTVLLRHRDHHLNPETKARYHRKLVELLPDLHLPTEKDESENPEGADRLYASCGDFLREQTRDPGRFSLLLSENIQYGTRRNLLAVKSIALWIASPALMICGGAVWQAVRSQTPIEVALVCSLIVLLCLLFWLIRVNRDWVRTTAFTYAERLLAACDTLNQSTNTK